MGEEKLSPEELEAVKFMLSHLARFDDKANILIRGSGVTLILVAGLAGFLITFLSTERIFALFVFLLIPILLLCGCVISSSLLLWPKFTESVFFSKESYKVLEVKYRDSLAKKDKWIKRAIFFLVSGLLSFAGWLLYYFYLFFFIKPG